MRNCPRRSDCCIGKDGGREKGREKAREGQEKRGKEDEKEGGSQEEKNRGKHHLNLLETSPHPSREAS